MGDPRVNRWRQRGTICMWQNYRPKGEWNLTADDSACDALCEILDLMRDAPWSSKKELKLRKPGVVAGHNDNFERVATSLTIKYPKGRVPKEHWSLKSVNAEVSLEVGESRLRELREAVVDMKTGGGDYCIGADGQELWIWWYLTS